MNKGLFKFYPSLAAAAFCSLTGAVSLLTACSDSTSTAGVLTETESGQTASLTISVNTNLEVGDSSEISSRPRVALMRTANDRSEIIDSAVTDTNNEVTFKNVPYSDFSIVAMGMDPSGAITFGNIITDKILESKELLNDTGFVETHLEINLYETAKIRLNAAALEIAPGDSVCITGTLSCGVYDKTAQESGYISIENIPASTYSDSYVDYDQVEIIHDGAARKDTVYWRVFPGDDRTANKNAVVDIVSEWSFTLPSISLLDSLQDKTLDSLIAPIPVKRPVTQDDYIVCAFGSTTTSDFMDKSQNSLPWSNSNYRGADSITTWVMLPPMDSAVTIYKVHGAIYPLAAATNRIQYSDSFASGDSLYRVEFSEDSSIAVGFWIRAVGTEDSARHNILSLGSESTGFKIAQCERNAEYACSRIYSGLDSAATDSVIYGKAKILDGERHHVSFVIHKKHLTIAVDGDSFHDTDLKLSSEFYGLSGMLVGDYPLENLIVHSFGSYIRKDGEKDWTRLKAWLKAFYEMQKDF